MVDKQLTDYIKGQIEAGVGKEDIKAALLQHGWKEEDITEAFVASKGGVPVPQAPKTSDDTAKEVEDPLMNKKRNLHPRAVWIFFFRTVTVWIFLGIYLVFQLGYSVMSLTKTTGSSAVGAMNILVLGFIAILAFVLILAYVVAKLSYRFYKFELTENEYKAERGIIWKRYISIPYGRIQNVDIYRGLLSRILGLSDLNIQTAGYSAMSLSGKVGSEGRLPGLGVKDAEVIREELIKKARNARPGI